MGVIDDINKAQLQSEENTKRAEEMNQALKETNGTPQQMTYQQMVDKLYDGKKARTKEDIEAEEKRQQRNLRLARIGDALSAFHTAYSNARGVKPMVNPGESLTGKMRERYERLNKEREARDREYNTIMLRAKQLDEQNKLSWKALKDKEEARKAAEARAELMRQDKLAQQQSAAQQKAEELAERRRHNEAMEKRPAGRGSSGTKKNQDWTTTVVDKDGKIKQQTTRTYGSGGGQRQQPQQKRQATSGSKISTGVNWKKKK
jgi:hypothetical protein